MVQGSPSGSEGVNCDEGVEPRRGATRNMLSGEPVKALDVFVGLATMISKPLAGNLLFLGLR